MRLGWGIATVAVVVCASGHASAQPPKVRRFAFDIEAQAGWMEGRYDGGAALGLTGRARYRFLTAGVSLQGATHLLGSMGALSAVAGLSAPLGLVRLDVLAEGGVNGSTGVGSNFLNGDPGAAATLPFAGVRSAALFRIHRARQGVGIWLGPSFQYARDLTTVTRAYQYRREDDGWLFGDTRTEWVTRTVTFGQTRYSLLVVLCATLPL